MKKAMLVLVVALPMLVVARDDRGRDARFSEQVRRDAQSSSDELRSAAQALLWANEAAARAESQRNARRAVEDFYEENPNGRSGGLVLVPGPMKDVDKKEFRRAARFAAQSGQAVVVGGSSREVPAEEVQAALAGTFQAEVRYQEARKNAGLSYNTDMEPYFKQSPNPVRPHKEVPTSRPRATTKEAFMAEIMPGRKAVPASISISTRTMGKSNRRQGGIVKGTFGTITVRLADAHIGFRPLLSCSFVIDCTRLGLAAYSSGRSGFELCSFLYDIQDGSCVRWSGARTLASENGADDSPFSENSSAERRSLQNGEKYETSMSGGLPVLRKLDRYEIGNAESMLFPDEACYYRLEVWIGGTVAAVKEGTCNYGRKPAGLPQDWFVPLHNGEIPPFRKTFFSKVCLYPPGDVFLDGKWPVDFRKQ